jgi:alpha-tubulin suppressor-like RCC1 family protein
MARTALATILLGLLTTGGCIPNTAKELPAWKTSADSSVADTSIDVRSDTPSPSDAASDMPRDTGGMDADVAQPSECAPRAGAWAGVSVGATHVCAWKVAGGTAYCWGDNALSDGGGFGKLGVGETPARSPVPLPVVDEANEPVEPVTRLSAGEEHTCAVVGLDTVSCWGSSADFRSDPTDDAPMPRARSIDLGDHASNQVVDIAVGQAHTCAAVSPVFGTQVVRCWGENDDGESGTESDADTGTRRVVGADDTVAVTAGTSNACARDTSGAVRCWGTDESSIIADDACGGDGICEDATVPGYQPSSFSQISIGSDHICGVTSGEVFCWGNDQRTAWDPDSGDPRIDTYKLGIPREHASTQLDPIDGGISNFTQVGAGADHSCAVTEDGALYCWGWNSTGEVGVEPVAGEEATPPTEVPRVADGCEWAKVSAGQQVTCAITEPGALFCWGANDAGQLGDDTGEPGHEPRRIPAPPD